MVFGDGVIRLKNFENIRQLFIGKKLRSFKPKLVESPNAPWSKEDLSRILIWPIFCLSATIDLLIVLSPTNVPKFNPILCLSISAKNSPIVCQFILIFEVSAHRPISLAEASPKNGAKEEPQFPPMIVVIPWLTKLSWRGKEKNRPMGVGVAGYVNEARRHASAGRVNDIISGFCLQVAYFFNLIIRYANVGFYGLIAPAVKNQSVFNYC